MTDIVDETLAENETLAESANTWSEDYDALIKHPPKEGDILGSMDDSKVILVVELKDGSPPFIYGCVFVPEIVGQPLGWYMQSVDSLGMHGFKCILMPRARTELIRREGLKGDIIEVTSLKVVRHSQSGKSLLCEVEEY